MYHHMYGDWNSTWDWLWITLMMFFWVVVIGAVVYAAARLANQHDRQSKPPVSP